MLLVVESGASHSLSGRDRGREWEKREWKGGWWRHVTLLEHHLFFLITIVSADGGCQYAYESRGLHFLSMDHSVVLILF